MLRKVVRLVLRTIVILIAATLVLVAAALILFFSIPEIEISTPQLKWLIARLVPSSVDLKFDEARFIIKRPPGLPLAKRFNLVMKGVCASGESPRFNACFSDLELEAEAGWGGVLAQGESRWFPHLIYVERFLFLGGDVAVDLANLPKRQVKTSKNPGQDLNASLAKFGSRVRYFTEHIIPKWHLENSRIEVPSLRVTPNVTTSYSARFELNPESSGNRGFSLMIENLRQANGPFQAHSPWQAEILTSFFFPEKGASMWSFASQSRLRWAGRRELELLAHVRQDSALRLDGRIKGTVRGDFPVRSFDLTARYGAMVVDGALSLEVVSGKSLVSELSLERCDWRLSFKRRNGNVTCGPGATRLVVAEGRVGARYFEPRLFTLQPQFDLRLTRINFGPEKAADLEFDFLLNHHGLAVLSAAMKGHFEKPLVNSLAYEVEGDSRIDVMRFSRIVQLLKTTPYAIPAPLNVLDGSVRLRAGVKIDNGGGEVVYRLTSGLDGQGESIHLRLEGTTSVVRGEQLHFRAPVPASNRDRTHLEVAGGDLARTSIARERPLRSATEATLAIDRLYLTAPRFDFGIPPRLAPDSRFGALNPVEPRSSSASTAAPMDIHLRIRTKDASSILVRSNLTKSPVPIALDLTYDEGKTMATMTKDTTAAKLTGSVTFGRTAIDAFRRNATLEKLKIDLGANGINKLTGRARVDDPQYNISIFLFGTTAEPVVRFASNPPLTDEQIISVLLFGRPLNELGEDQKGSVANLEAAFADAALGLSSIYLLAHTPVESIGYDVGRGMASVNVGVGGGASIELGTGGQSNVIGFRKRLGHGFVFRSDVETLGSTGQHLISALVEWNKWF